MIEEIEEELKKEIVRMFCKGKKLEEIADLLRKPVLSVARVLNENKDAILKNKEQLGEFEENRKIKTIDTIAKLHEETLKIANAARQAGDYLLALQALKEAREQTTLIMKNKGELDPKIASEERFDEDFVKFLISSLEKEGIIKVEKDGSNSNLSKTV